MKKHAERVRKRIAHAKKDIAHWRAKGNRLEGEMVNDAHAAVIAAKEAEVQALEKEAAAAEKGDRDALEAAKKAVREEGSKSRIVYERFRAVEAASRFATDEKYLEHKKKYLPDSMDKQFNAMIAARKEAAAAWHSVAEACAGGKDLSEIEKAKDHAYAMESAAYIAEKRLHLDSDRARLAQEAEKYSSPAVSAALASLELLDGKLLEAKTREAESRIEIRKLERARHEASDAMRQSLHESKKQAHEAKAQKNTSREKNAEPRKAATPHEKKTTVKTPGGGENKTKELDAF